MNTQKKFIVNFTLNGDEESITIFAKNIKDAKKKFYTENSEHNYARNVSIVKSKNIGLAILRAQPLHLGHIRIINKMLMEMDTVIIALGSVQERGTINNPWGARERKEMVEKIYGKNSKIKIIDDLKDINAVSKVDWAIYVIGILLDKRLPIPTHYYAGTEHDASWFSELNHKFGKNTINIEIVDRHHSDYMMSGTDIRKAISTDNDEWSDFVPSVLIDYIEETFPEDLKVNKNPEKIEKEKAEKWNKGFKALKNS